MTAAPWLKALVPQGLPTSQTLRRIDLDSDKAKAIAAELGARIGTPRRRSPAVLPSDDAVVDAVRRALRPRWLRIEAIVLMTGLALAKVASVVNRLVLDGELERFGRDGSTEVRLYRAVSGDVEPERPDESARDRVLRVLGEAQAWLTATQIGPTCGHATIDRIYAALDELVAERRVVRREVGAVITSSAGRRLSTIPFYALRDVALASRGRTRARHNSLASADDAIAEAFGRAIREARTAKGMSSRELARQVSRSPASVSNWERGGALPRREAVEALCDALGLNRLDHAVADALATSGAR